MPWFPTDTDQMTWGGTNLNDTTFMASVGRVGVVVTQITGLIEQPPNRVENFDRPGKHGSRRGSLYLSSRPFAIEGYVFGANQLDLETRKAALQDTLVPLVDDVVVFAFTHQSQGAQQVEARVEQELSWGDPFEFGVLQGSAFIVGCVAHDPRRYSQTLQSVQTSLVSSGTGGMSFPVVFPLSFSPGAVGSSVTIPAGGNFERGAIIECLGPATNPVIEEIGNEANRRIVFQGVTLAGAETLTIDLDEQTAYKDVTNVYGSLDFALTRWFTIPPTAMTLRYRADSMSDPAIMTVNIRDANV